MGMRIKKGDTVLVLAGRDKGARGEVVEVLPKKGHVVVEGVNIVHKHTKRAGEKPGGIIETPAPMPVCKVMLVDPKSGIAGRVKMDTDASGNKIRRSKRTSNEV